MTIEYTATEDTATLHSIRIGKTRQLTLSAYKQLDHVEPQEIEAWGRVKGANHGRVVGVIGKHRGTGELVCSVAYRDASFMVDLLDDKARRNLDRVTEALERAAACETAYPAWAALPLIILGGLK